MALSRLPGKILGEGQATHTPLSTAGEYLVEQGRRSPLLGREHKLSEGETGI